MTTQQSNTKKIKNAVKDRALPSPLLNQLMGSASPTVLAGGRNSPELKELQGLMDDVNFAEGVLFYQFKENDLNTKPVLARLNKTLLSAKKSLLGYEQFPKPQFGRLSVKCSLNFTQLLSKATSIIIPLKQLQEIDKGQWISKFVFYIGYQFNDEQRFAKLSFDIRLQTWSNDLCDWSDELHSLALKVKINF